MSYLHDIFCVTKSKIDKRLHAAQDCSLSFFPRKLNVAFYLFSTWLTLPICVHKAANIGLSSSNLDVEIKWKALIPFTAFIRDRAVKYSVCTNWEWKISMVVAYRFKFMRSSITIYSRISFHVCRHILFR